MIQSNDSTAPLAVDLPRHTELDPAALGEAAAQPRSRNGSGGQQSTLSLNQILDATSECLAESGYDGTTIRRIAARLSCAVGSIYRYCSDKRALLSAVTQRRFDAVAQSVDDHVPIAQTALAYANTAAADAQQYRLMFWLASLEPSAQHGGLPPIVRRIIDGWARQLGDPRAAQRLWSQMHGDLMLGLAPQMILDDLAQTGAPVNQADAEPAAGDADDASAEHAGQSVSVGAQA